MDQYRKSDQYYIDQYDRMTIKRLKELEERMNEAEKRFHIDQENPMSENTNIEYLSFRFRYNDTGVHYARDKRTTIDSWIAADEKKDKLIRLNPAPSDVKCNICDVRMKFEMHDFLQGNSDLIFFFSCPNGHLPMKPSTSSVNMPVNIVAWNSFQTKRELSIKSPLKTNARFAIKPKLEILMNQTT